MALKCLWVLRMERASRHIAGEWNFQRELYGCQTNLFTLVYNQLPDSSHILKKLRCNRSCSTTMVVTHSRTVNSVCTTANCCIISTTTVYSLENWETIYMTYIIRTVQPCKRHTLQLNALSASVPQSRTHHRLVLVWFGYDPVPKNKHSCQKLM